MTAVRTLPSQPAATLATSMGATADRHRAPTAHRRRHAVLCRRVTALMAHDEGGTVVAALPQTATTLATLMGAIVGRHRARTAHSRHCAVVRWNGVARRVGHEGGPAMTAPGTPMGAEPLRVLLSTGMGRPLPAVNAAPAGTEMSWLARLMTKVVLP